MDPIHFFSMEKGKSQKAKYQEIKREEMMLQTNFEFSIPAFESINKTSIKYRFERIRFKC